MGKTAAAVKAESSPVIQERAFDPDKLLAVEEENTRYFENDGDTKDIEASIEQAGQIQPIGVREDGRDQYKVVYGFRRLRAMRNINKRRTASGQRPLPIVARVLKGVNAEDAFLTNLAENRNRKNTSAIEDAYNIRRLQKEFNKTDAQIAGYFIGDDGKPMSPAWVGTTLDLLKLPTEQQRLIHTGELAAATGYRLSQIPEALRNVVYIDAKLAAGKEAHQELKEEIQKSAKVSEQEAEVLAEEIKAQNYAIPAKVSKVVTSKAHKRILSKAAAAKKPKVQTKHVTAAAERRGAISDKRVRKLSDVKDFVDEHTKAGTPPNSKVFFKKFQLWLNGELETGKLKTEVNKLG